MSNILDQNNPIVCIFLILYGLAYIAAVGLFTVLIKKPAMWLYRGCKHFVLRYPAD